MSLPSDVLALLAGLDRMYEAAVMEPGEHGEASLLSWGESLLAERAQTASLDRRVPRLVRKGARNAVKLRRHWEERAAGGGRLPEDWTSRVDEALGGRAWLPGLELAQWGLSTEPDPELFVEVGERFRVAYARPWMEGVTYEEYVSGAEGRGG